MSLIFLLGSCAKILTEKARKALLRYFVRLWKKFLDVREAGRTPRLSEGKLVFFIHYTSKFLCNQCGDPWIGTRAFASFWDLYVWSRPPHFQPKILPYGTRPTLRRDLDHIRMERGRRLIAC